MTSETRIPRGNFDFAAPIVVFGFAKGEDAEALYSEVCKTIKTGVWYNNGLLYIQGVKDAANTMTGNNTLLSARVDSIVRPLGIRVPTLVDLSRPEVMKMIGCQFYSDAPAIFFRTMEDRFEPNSLLIKKLAPLIEAKVGKLELPALITGFDVVPSKDGKGYGLNIVARKDFTVLHDERLSGEYDGKKFSTVDENGLPNFKKDGKRTWYCRNKGLSGVFLRNSNLGSRDSSADLACSYENGRIVLVKETIE